MTDLDKLIEAVEAGRNIPMGYAADALHLPGLDERWGIVDAANRGSLDAAKRLHDTLLPGACVNDMSQAGKGRWYVVIACDVAPHYFYGDDGNPARAWLLAILRAVKAQAQL